MSVVDPSPYPTITALPVPVIESTTVTATDPWAPLVLAVVALAVAMVTVRRRGAFVAAGLLLLAFDVARLQVTGVAVLGAGFLLVAFWLFGGFTREFWIDDARSEGVDQ